MKRCQTRRVNAIIDAMIERASTGDGAPVGAFRPRYATYPNGMLPARYRAVLFDPFFLVRELGVERFVNEYIQRMMPAVPRINQRQENNPAKNKPRLAFAMPSHTAPDITPINTIGAPMKTAWGAKNANDARLAPGNPVQP